VDQNIVLTFQNVFVQWYMYFIYHLETKVWTDKGS